MNRRLGNKVDPTTASCRAASLGAKASKSELAAVGRPLPRYMLKAAGGNEKTALTMWAETLKWRCEINDEALLGTPNPNFERIHRHYQTFLHFPDKAGRLTYWELLKTLDPSALKKEGIGFDDLVYHYLWQTFFTWDVAATDDVQEVTVILDYEDFYVSTLTPTLFKTLMHVSKLLRKHFPQRQYAIFVINAPSWWKKVYRVLAPLVSKSQRDKVRVIVGKEKSLETLKQMIDPANLPPQYGGTSMPLGASPLELKKAQLAKYGRKS